MNQLDFTWIYAMTLIIWYFTAPRESSPRDSALSYLIKLIGFFSLIMYFLTCAVLLLHTRF